MRRKPTITIDEMVCQGFDKLVGRGHISQVIESSVRPRVAGAELEDGYRRIAHREDREADALVWAEAAVGDAADEAR